MLPSIGVTFSQTSPNSGRVFGRIPSRLRMLWMCAGAVLDFASDLALLLAGLRQEPFASHLENDYH
jgi:hypothetical protein